MTILTCICLRAGGSISQGHSPSRYKVHYNAQLQTQRTSSTWII